MYTETEAQFLEQVKDHVMTVRLDGGVYRDILFARPETRIYSFNLVTWPGHLCISGDMGTYVFSRVKDMFTFFRPDEGSESLQINPDYWGEKLQAICKLGKYKEYDEDLFLQAIESDFGEWSFKTEEDKNKSWSEVEDEILCFSDSEHDAYDSAYSFKDSYGNSFVDFFEHHLTEHTPHYIWCIRAIAWGIKQYDALPKEL